MLEKVCPEGQQPVGRTHTGVVKTTSSKEWQRRTGMD